ncbi:MAG: hypothetical protein ABFR35_11490 [Thermodesulfobacteriota bacterium]
MLQAFFRIKAQIVKGAKGSRILGIKGKRERDKKIKIIIGWQSTVDIVQFYILNFEFLIKNSKLKILPVIGNTVQPWTRN